MSKLYERSFYTNTDIKSLINTPIIEYDIKSGGFNVCKFFKLLSDKKIEKLESLGKKDRQIQLGLYQKKQKGLSKQMEEGFKKCREMFFKANDLANEDVVSIKRDALFVTKPCYKCEFENILFREKNIYSSYYYIDGKELYYNKDRLDVKGIDDIKLVKHKDYMLSFLSNIFRCIEEGSYDYARKTLREFSDYYRHRALDIGYYREFNSDSLFMTDIKFMGDYMGLHDTGDLSIVNINYNYTHIIVPLISILS